MSKERSLVVYLKRHYRLSLVERNPGAAPASAATGRRPCRNGNIWNGRDRKACRCRWRSAGGEFIGPWGRLQSFIAVEELTDMLPLHEAVPAAAAALDPATFRAGNAA